MISVNGEKINVTRFPDNTSQVWQISGINTTSAKVVWEYDLESEFMQLAQLKTLLDSRSIKATLYMPFLPYSRQDKPVSNDATFGLVTFARLLNSLNFEAVFTLDAHSGVAKELIKNLNDMVPVNYVKIAEIHTNSDVVCYPDKGALQKYSGKVSEKPFVFGEKVRDQQTGKIQDMKLVGGVKGKKVLIVDDIIDGGGTFCWMSQLLYNNGASEVNLYGTHGIFSKGLGPLRDAGIKRIFTRKGEISDYQGNICYKPNETSQL
jgi:ribose-phosphate pyrophosphokinase